MHNPFKHFQWDKIQFLISLYSPHKNIYLSDFEYCHELRKCLGKASLRMIISQGTQSLTRSLQRCKFARRSIAHLRSYLEKEVPFASDACCAHTMSGGLVARPRICTIIASGDSTSSLPRRMHPRMLQCYRGIVISLRLLRCFNTFVLYLEFKNNYCTLQFFL